MNRPFCLYLCLALITGLVACESPDDQTYDPVLDEKIGDPDAPLVPDDPEDGLADRVQYTCAGGERFFLSRSDDGRIAVLALDERTVTLTDEGDGVYRDDTATFTVQFDGDRASVDLDSETAYRDCEPQR